MNQSSNASDRYFGRFANTAEAYSITDRIREHFRVLSLKGVSIFLPSPKPNASASNLINAAKFDGAAGSEIKKNINIIWDAI